jgi:enamine deaminase RidA (YjgF/YER057c/UK114 family)
MLTNFQETPGREPGLPGSAPAGLPPEGCQARKLLDGSAGSGRGCCTVHASPAGPGQTYIVAQTAPGAEAGPAAQAAYREIARTVQNQGLTIVHERLFGSLTAKAGVLAARQATFSAAGLAPESPLSYIQGQPAWGEGLAGVIIRAVACRRAGDEVWTIRDRGKPVGRGWRQGEATFLVLQNLQGLAPNGNGAKEPPHQTRRLIQRAAHLLEAQGASYRDVVRTWFTLSDILAWYPEFNRARSAVYRELGLMPINGGDSRRLPASTGIGGQVSPGSAGALDLLAVTGPRGSRPRVRQLSSPAQPDALTYGSAFSRGALIQQGEVSLIQVSGTAAIDARGQSLHPGDVRAQIDCTFDKIAALIGPLGATLADIVAASVFIKRPEDAPVYAEMAAARGLADLPAVVMAADVCREELLFEMDAEVAFDPVRRIYA